MKKDKLREFYNDKAMQEAWADFMVETLNEEILKRAYAGKSTDALPEARNVIQASFASLRDRYEPVEKREVENKGV